MGIKTVAVYSDADADALHVREADEAVRDRPGAARRRAICRSTASSRPAAQTGAEAVHPGYGFLSEKRGFAAALAKAGIAFIGPDAPRDRRHGRQDRVEEARAEAAGVSTVPGHLDAIADADAGGRRSRASIGYPVMIKAAAGGGGKGMRMAAQRRASCAKASARPQRGARPLRRRPRLHREIHRGAAPHRNPGAGRRAWQRRSISASANARSSAATRRSSRRRRSPFLDAKTRAAMGEQAVALAKAVQLPARPARSSSSSTPERNFYFLEMNTRLQVEHPVTELVTGLDLVELMIRIAAGEKLPFAQDDIKLQRLGDRGARLCRGPVPQLPALDRRG